jgi:transposase InsO family protein
MSFGPKKVMDYLRRTESFQGWPADSTAGEILKEAGLVKPRKRRQWVSADSEPFKDCDVPNRVWSADFKGQFRLGNGRWCYPLTMTDNYSRYILQCRGLGGPKDRAVRPWFEWVFREYGLPQAIRTDNGVPFASMALGGISQLSKWWIQMGVKPERIRPGKPQENGRHERMHKSLKNATAVPPQRTMRAQQRVFDHFVNEFNEDRSHEALDRKTPSQVYAPSPRSYPSRIKPVEYDCDYIVRRVRHNGQIKWRGKKFYLSQVLSKEPIGLKQVDNHLWDIYFSFYCLGTLNEKTGKIRPPKDWHGRHPSTRV